MWAVDTETTGLKWFKGDKPFYFTAYNGKEYIAEETPDRIKQIVEDPTIVKIFHNAKFDIHMFRTVGITVQGTVIDTMIASFILDEYRSHKLKELARTVLDEDTTEELAIEQWFKENKILKDDRRYDQLPREILKQYALKDVKYTYDLWDKFEPQIIDQGLNNLFKNECELIYVLVDMEQRGVKIDVEATQRLSNKLYIELLEIEADIAAVYGKDFNFNSPKQLGEKLKEEGNVLKFTSKGSIKTDAETLESYTSELAVKVLSYRKKAKLRTTYCEGFLNLMDENGIIHPDFKQIGAKTGRFSCAAPNLQNLPKPSEEKPETKLIRSLFIPRENYTGFYFDQDQVEYRIAAHYLNDQELIERINNGEDVHTIQAQRIFKKQDVTKEERSIAKTINFAILYGAGLATVAKKLNKTTHEAKRILDIFYKENPNVFKVKEKIRQAIIQKGYIFNTFGRRRHMEINDHYKGFNSLCQGLAGDIMKHSMVNIHRILKDTNSYMLINVHDELVFEIYKGEEYLVPKIKEIMENFDHMFKVKITVGIDYSTTNWAEKKEWDWKQNCKAA